MENIFERLQVSSRAVSSSQSQLLLATPEASLTAILGS
jgi:hypothetical protein